MQMSPAEKLAFVNALDRAKRTVHPDLVICTRRYEQPNTLLHDHFEMVSLS